MIVIMALRLETPRCHDSAPSRMLPACGRLRGDSPGDVLPRPRNQSGGTLLTLRRSTLSLPCSLPWACARKTTLEDRASIMCQRGHYGRFRTRKQAYCGERTSGCGKRVNRRCGPPIMAPLVGISRIMSVGPPSYERLTTRIDMFELFRTVHVDLGYLCQRAR